MRSLYRLIQITATISPTPTPRYDSPERLSEKLYCSWNTTEKVANSRYAYPRTRAMYTDNRSTTGLIVNILSGRMQALMNNFIGGISDLPLGYSFELPVSLRSLAALRARSVSVWVSWRKTNPSRVRTPDCEEIVSRVVDCNVIQGKAKFMDSIDRSYLLQSLTARKSTSSRVLEIESLQWWGR